MISWRKLNYSLSALSKLRNGGGSEVEFCLNDKRYIIVHYCNKVTLAYCPHSSGDEGGSIEYEYESMDELGSANDFGFRLKDRWKSIPELVCRPDFDEYSLQDILDSYRKALDDEVDQK